MPEQKTTTLHFDGDSPPPAAPPATPTATPAGVAPSGQPAPAGQQPAGEQPTAPPTIGGDRVYAGKYRSVEELERGYQELERRAGSTPPAEPKGKAPAGGPPITPDFLRPFVEEYESTGTFTPESEKRLSEAGMSPEVARAFVATSHYARQRAASEYRGKIVGEVGGEDEFRALAEWAGTALTAEEREEINREIKSFDEGRARRAVRDLQYRRRAALNGQDGGQLRGRPGGGGGEAPFASMEEMMAAMRDPRYRNGPKYDPNYEESVRRRAAGARF